MDGELNERQRALLELLKVTHHHARDHVVNLEVAHFYLAAIDAEGAERAPTRKKKDAA